MKVEVKIAAIKIEVPKADTTSPRALQSDHHTMMGSTDDPKDGKAVARSIFAAVVVYAVRFFTYLFTLNVPLRLLLLYYAVQHLLTL